METDRRTAEGQLKNRDRRRGRPPTRRRRRQWRCRDALRGVAVAAELGRVIAAGVVEVEPSGTRVERSRWARHGRRTSYRRSLSTQARPLPGPPGQVDRNALLYRYTVALASNCFVYGLACSEALHGGVASKDGPGHADGNDGGNAIGPSEPLTAWRHVIVNPSIRSP